MYLKRNRKMSGGVSYDYWTLVESVRTAGGPRQRVVANVGKLFGGDDEEKIGWERIGEILSGKEKDRTPDMFAPAEAEVPDWAVVDLRSVRVERMRRFGDVFLALCVWRRLGLDEIFDRIAEEGRDEYKLSLLACVLAIGRLCEQSSELELAQSTRFLMETAPMSLRLKIYSNLWRANTAGPIAFGSSTEESRARRSFAGFVKEA